VAKVQYPRQEGFALAGLERCVVLRVVITGETIIVNRYQQQLTNLSDALEETIYWLKTS